MLINDAVVSQRFNFRVESFWCLGGAEITADVQSVPEAPAPVVATSLGLEQGSTCSCGLIETLEVVFPCC